VILTVEKQHVVLLAERQGNRQESEMTERSETRSRFPGAVILVLVTLAVWQTPVLAEAATLTVKQRINFDGPGRWDYIVPDSASDRLYIARTDRFMVLHPNSGKLIGEIPSAPNAHGVALVKELGMAFTTDGGSNTSTVFDLNTLKVITKINVGKNPDSIVYDGPTKRVFVFNGDSNDVSVIDATKRAVIATIVAPGKPEFSVADDKGNVYFNVEDKNAIARIDVAALKVKDIWTIAPCEEPAGLAIDTKKRVLFSGCSNKLLAVINADTGKVLGTVPIGEDNDGVFFDAAADRVYAATGDGHLYVISSNANRTYHVVQDIPTAEGSKTMGLDPKTGRIYVPTAEFGPKPPGAKRPPVVPGTFSVWVIGQ